MQAWLDQNCFTQDAKSILSVATRAILCCEPSEVSFLYWLQLCKAAGSLERLAALKHGAQHAKFIGGSQQISVSMAEALGSKVQLNSPVDHIKWSGSKNESSGLVSVFSRGKEFKGKHVILGVSPALYSTIKFTPPLPSVKAHMGLRMPMGSILKTVTYYRTAFWREKANGKDCFSGSILSNGGPVSYSIDDTKYDGTFPAIMGFVVGENARIWSQKTKEERRKAIAEQYARCFATDEALKSVGYLEKNWMDEEYSRGCYLAYSPPGIITQFGTVLRERVGSIHFAGTELATKWMGYMDGAIQSGERAAYQVLLQLKKEKPSLEVPSYLNKEDPESPEMPWVCVDQPWILNQLPGIRGLYLSIFSSLCIIVASWAYSQSHPLLSVFTIAIMMIVVFLQAKFA